MGARESPLEYRSLSFHRARIPNRELVKQGAEVGFNDITFQTEGAAVLGGGPVQKFEAFRHRADEEGYFELADQLNMTVSIWTTAEFDDYNKKWGPITLNNEKLWNAIEARYSYILTTLLPEIDYLVLKVSESEYPAADPPLLTKIVETINRECRKTDTTLIFRPFHRKHDELDWMVEAISEFPNDVIIQNKNFPQDWHQRSIDNPLIGTFDDHTEFVEVDFDNEYAHYDNLANCFTDTIERQFESWVENGVTGVAARVARQPQPPGMDPEDGMFDILGHPNEANMWVLGYLASGKSQDPDDAWADYTECVFGAEAAATMEKVLRPTGHVAEEGLCVKELNFGRTKWNGTVKTEEGNIPAHKTMHGEHNSTMFAQRYTDEEAESRTWTNPFFRRASRWRFDDAYKPTYHKIRKGHPDVIEEKTRAYEEAESLAEESLALLKEVKDELPSGAYEYFQFRLAENRFFLRVRCEMQLAWLKAENNLYFGEGTDDEMLKEVKDHLYNLADMIDEYNESVSCEWQGVTYNLSRGGNQDRFGADFSHYIDIPGYIHQFRRYWQLEDMYKM